MTAETTFPGWDWNDPDGLGPRMDAFSAEVARCERLESIDGDLPSSRKDFLDLGVTGIEFAAFKTKHTSGLGTDLAELRSADDTATERGRVYRVDGERYFTQLDICEPLPFADDCVDWVYAEHLIEHVPLPAAISWLAEVRRILAPGGLLRITTPDLRKYAEAYIGDEGFFSKHRRRLRLMRLGPPMPARRAFMFNQIFYLYGHRWIYDPDEVRYALSEAGFDPEDVRLCTFQQGARQDIADLDVSFRNDETIYMEVTAPTSSP